MTDLQAKLLIAFDSEYRSIVETIRAKIQMIESAGERLSDADLNEAFRMAHTLKGSAHVVGLTTVVTVGHRLESLFARVREGKVTLGVSEARLVHGALGLIEDIVGAFHSGHPLPDHGKVVASLEAVIEKGHAAESRPPPVLAVVPSAPTAKPEPTPTTLEHGSGEGETLRLSARHLDQLLDTSGELLGLIRGGREIDRTLGRIGGHVDALAREWDLLRRTSASAMQKMNHFPEYARIAQFLDFVGQQIPPIAKNLRVVRASAKQNDWDFLNLGEQLQEDIRRARTVPAETVLGGFYKMMRDLATALDRPVDFRIVGLDVAADRGVLQALKDPLMHILRNSLSHGLEAAEERRARGKDVNGKVSVRLAAEHGRLNLTITDDGRGLNEAKIRERAVASGLVTAEVASTLSRDRIFEFIFKPGFSTADSVTDIAGRGMGMSVVEEAIKRLQGSLSVTSRDGLGATFVLSVPVTLTNHHLVQVRQGDQIFALASNRIESLRRVARTDVRLVDGMSTLLLDDRPTPLVSLGALLGGENNATGGEFVNVVVLEDEGRVLAVAVDAILDKREALIKNLTPELRRLELFAGAINQGDGSVTLVLSAETLVARGSRRGFALDARAPAEAAAPEKTGPARILVVDDSITTRTLERGILEASGFEVALAVDGVDALAKLNVEAFDLVISDVEMPRMDGFTLVGEIKKSPKLRHLPVIMVTSLEKPADRARGLELGANAYVLKQKFDQGGLLDLIRGIL